MMIPTWGAKLRILRQVSIPPAPGMLMSNSTKSKDRCCTTPTASSPLLASATANPLAANDVRRVFRRDGSSSTTRTLGDCDDMVSGAFHVGDRQAETDFIIPWFLGGELEGAPVGKGDLPGNI